MAALESFVLYRLILTIAMANNTKYYIVRVAQLMDVAHLHWFETKLVLAEEY